MSDVETEGEPQVDAREEDGVAVDRNRQDRMADMKLHKVRAKNKTTAAYDAERRECRSRTYCDRFQALEDATEQVFNVLTELCEMYYDRNEEKSAEKTMADMETIEKEYSAAENRASDILLQFTLAPAGAALTAVSPAQKHVQPDRRLQSDTGSNVSQSGVQSDENIESRRPEDTAEDAEGKHSANGSVHEGEPVSVGAEALADS